MSYPSLSGYMVALAALVPKRGASVLATKLASCARLPVEQVRAELQPMVDAGALAYDAQRDEYSHVAEAGLS